jgi:hypothetical protein
MATVEVIREQFIIYPYLGAATIKQTVHIVTDSSPPFNGIIYNETLSEIEAAC